MSGAILLLLVMMMAGGGRAGISPGLVQMFVSMRKDSFEKWSTIIKQMQTILVAAYFYLRGPQEFKDAAGNPATSVEAANKRIESFQKDFLSQTFIGKLLDGLVDSIIALLKPSAAEEAIMTALLSGNFGGAAAPSTVNVVSQPAPAPAPRQRTAAEVLRGGPTRAQGVYVDEFGRVVAY